MSGEAFTQAERFGIRRLLDCGIVSEKRGDSAIRMYRGLKERRLVDVSADTNGRVVIRFTEFGRALREQLEGIAL